MTVTPQLFEMPYENARDEQSGVWIVETVTSRGRTVRYEITGRERAEDYIRLRGGVILGRKGEVKE